jgi:hypothetical protein
MTRSNDHLEGDDDRLARSVARCFFENPALGWAGAFEKARRIVGVLGRGAMPSHALVRRHLEALEEARFGDEGARVARRERVVAIVELLEFVRFVLEPTELVLVGLLARGVAVGPLEVHARVLGGRPFQELYGQLESVGIKEVSASSTVGPMGRFESVRFDSDGWPYTVTRIPQAQFALTEGRNLATGKPINETTLDAFSEFFAAPTGDC